MIGCMGSQDKTMFFDRFDICEAHYLFACLYHEGMGSETYAKFAQLERIEFRCAPGIQEPRDLSENGRSIFRDLVVAHCGVHSTAKGR